MKAIMCKQLKDMIQKDLDNIAAGHRPGNYSNYPSPRLTYCMAGFDLPYWEKCKNKPLPPPTRYAITVAIVEHRFSASSILESMRLTPRVDRWNTPTDKKKAMEEYVVSMRINPRNPFVIKWEAQESGEDKDLIVLTTGGMETAEMPEKEWSPWREPD